MSPEVNTYQSLPFEARSAVATNFVRTRYPEVCLTVGPSRSVYTNARVLSDEVTARACVLTRVTETFVDKTDVVWVGIIGLANRSNVT